MKLAVIAVGRLKERFWREAEEEYRKRLLPHASLSVEEVRDEPDTGPAARVLAAEGARIAERLQERDYVIALDIDGSRLSSELFAKKVAAVAGMGHSRIVFIIGGSRGLAPDVLRRSHLRLSFSDFTFPHQMMRIILLEQVYRAFTIMAGTKYHK